MKHCWKFRHSVKFNYQYHPTRCTKFHNNKFISSLYMFRAHVFIVRRAKLYYTASGIIKPTGGRPVHRLREDSPQHVHRTATYRCDDTRECIIQFCPPDDDHMCSKHVEAWNKLIIKFNESSWLILINKYIEMHGQQNIKILQNVNVFLYPRACRLNVYRSTCCSMPTNVF